MKSGTMFEQGNILIVPFPFSDLSNIKKRPVLVLSKTNENNCSDDIIICGITSNLKDRKHAILVDDSCLIDGFIPSKSAVKVDKLFTINKSIVIKKVARLNKETFKKVKEEFCRLM